MWESFMNSEQKVSTDQLSIRPPHHMTDMHTANYLLACHTFTGNIFTTLRTIARCLTKTQLLFQCLLHVLPLTPLIVATIWNCAALEGIGLQLKGIRLSSERNPDLIWGVMTVVYMRLCGECLKSAFPIQQYFAPTTGVMVGVPSYMIHGHP